MEEPRNNGEEMEKEVERFPTGKLEHEEEKGIIHIPEDAEGENYTMKANEEQKDEKTIDSPKKSIKNNLKTNVTVPRPFNLATEKRMTRERKGSMDFEKPTKRSLPRSASLKPSLSKSASFNPKTSSDLKGPKSSSNMTSLKPKVRISEKEDKNIEVKHTENHLKHGGDKSKNTPKENCGFKALSLPSFYKQKDFPATSETKKMMVVQRSRTPVVSTQVKTLLKSDSHRIESNGRTVSMRTGSGTKETITKVIRNTKNSLKTNPKATVKDLILSVA